MAAPWFEEAALGSYLEQRYQTATGLAADLELALQQRIARGQIEAFPLGQRDFSPKLQLPQTLLSREHES